MSRVEEALLRRFSGLTIMVAGAAIALVGVLPLLLCGEFGPADGNPIGLGLLAVVAVPLGGACAAVGLVTTLIQYFLRRGR